ncbi:MAG: diaminopimelate decarboxylase [Phototrophicaceae bacterium]
MTLNDSIHYKNKQLYVDKIAVNDIVTHMGSPTYIYSLARTIGNYQRIETAFAHLNPHIHYSAKANGNLQILRALINVGAGIDCVSGGEIYKALHAGASATDLVFAGVGKSIDEIQFALENQVGWFNVENIRELDHINRIAGSLGRTDVKIALRLNPEVTANTHPYIATGHGGAKFGLTAKTIAHILQNQDDWSYLNFEGLHLHVGSQLGDTSATRQGIEAGLQLIQPYDSITTLNIGGGIPAPYDSAEIPSVEDFAQAVTPLVKGYKLILEPGRSIIADAGILATRINYIKQQAGQVFYIVDGSMTELIRPMLYQAKHQIVPANLKQDGRHSVQVVGPVCETTDVLGRDIDLPDMQVGDIVAILTTGAYGAVMASSYNARPRPAEIVVSENGDNWHIARKRETYEDLIRDEILD